MPKIQDIVRRIKAEVIVTREEMNVIENLWEAPRGWHECAAWSRIVRVANG